MVVEILPKGGTSARTAITGDAWLSSARALRYSLKWGNERNPCLVFYVSQGTALLTGRREGMTSNQYVPYVLGNTGTTMAVTMGLPNRKVELIPSKTASVRIEGCNPPS